MKKKQFLWLMIAIGILSTGSGCDSVKPVSTTQEIPTAEETNLVTTAPVSEGEQPAETTTVPQIADVLTTAATTPTTTGEEYEDTSLVELLMGQMTLEQKVCQMFIVTPESLTGYNGAVTEAGALSKESFTAYPVGGLIYFSDNLEDAPQTVSMLSTMQDYAQETTGVGLFLSVDEEGGTVARVADNLGTTKLYDMEYYGERHNPEEAYAIGNTIGSDLIQFGFNVDFAPVADVNLNPNNELGSRIFSSDPDIVGDMVSGVVSGLQNMGVSATLKHFPGLGAGDGNTHYDDFVLIERSYSELKEEEFKAFQAGIDAGADFVMVGHQITTAAGDQLPSDMSYTVVTDWLKGTLGFDGIVITDAQNMAAITENYSPATAAVQSVSAGVDVILMPMDLSNAVSGICDAVENGTISEERINESVYKIMMKKLEMGLLTMPEEDSDSTTTSTTTTDIAF